MIQIAKAILISFKDNEEERLFGKIMKNINKYGIVLQEYEDRKETIEIGDLCLDPSNLCVHQNGKAIEFTYREFFLLYHLAEFSGAVFSKEHLYEVLWKQYSFPNTTVSSVSSLVSKVRKKLSRNHSGIEYIQTVRYAGYRFNPQLKRLK